MFVLPCVRLLMSYDFLSSFPCTPFARIDPLNVSYYIENIFFILISPLFSIFITYNTENNLFLIDWLFARIVYYLEAP